MSTVIKTSLFYLYGEQLDTLKELIPEAVEKLFPNGDGDLALHESRKKTEKMIKPSKNKNILIVGICGVGKTWLMKSLIKEFKCDEMKQVKLVRYNSSESGEINIVGKYDGSMFEGSDKLSMSVSTSVDQYLEETSDNKFNVFEGDRFSNGKFIDKVKPIVLKILGDGSEGRENRGSSQSERQIKSITTRVGNINADMEFENSTECYNFINSYLKGLDGI